MTGRPQTVRVMIPMSKTDPNKVAFEDIPLPPPEMWEELNNANSINPVEKAPVQSQPQPAPAVSEPVKPVPSRPRKALRFTSGEFTKTVPLQFPFEDDELGAVSSVTVHRLSVGDVGELLDERTGEEADNFDIYARMTNIPADVLRGLMDVDGEEVSRVCFDFLPLLFRGVTSDPS